VSTTVSILHTLYSAKDETFSPSSRESRIPIHDSVYTVTASLSFTSSSIVADMKYMARSDLER